jgi:hypothetical protein
MSSETLNWSVYEAKGFPIFYWHEHEGESSQDAYNRAAEVVSNPANRITSPVLEEGRLILIHGISGLTSAKVDSQSYAEKGNYTYLLEFDETYFDVGTRTQKPCWICTGQFNLKAISRLQIYK